MRLAYLYSRYPVLSQTFCDTEMLALERLGFDLVVGSIHPPLTSHSARASRRLKAPVHYAPPQPILKLWEENSAKANALAAGAHRRHEQKYGPSFKAAPAGAQRHSISPNCLSAKESITFMSTSRTAPRIPPFF